MSVAAKFTFVSACIASGSLIAYVHYSQAADRERLHEGVRRDVERQRLKHLAASGAGNDMAPAEASTSGMVVPPSGSSHLPG